MVTKLRNPPASRQRPPAPTPLLPGRSVLPLTNSGALTKVVTVLLPHPDQIPEVSWVSLNDLQPRYPSAFHPSC